jgi:hypothetical protein
MNGFVFILIFFDRINRIYWIFLFFVSGEKFLLIKVVIPAKAGIQKITVLKQLDGRLRGHDDKITTDR